MAQLQGKNIMITGGAGFIGSNLAKVLAPNNNVRVLDNLSSGRLSNIADIMDSVEFINADIQADIADYFQDIDIVFHEAANVFITKSVSDPAFDARVNVMGTLNVLEACRKHAVKCMVFASSCSVYGEPVSLPITEEHPLSPKSPYAVGKLAGEHYCRVYHDLYGLETLSLRYFNVYGENQRADNPYSGVIAIFTDKAQKGERLTIFGDGEQTRDFVHVSDVVAANICAATSEKAIGKSINVGTGTRVSLNQLTTILNEITGKKVAVSYAPPRPGDVKHSFADTSLMTELLGHQPDITLKTGLGKLVSKD